MLIASLPFGCGETKNLLSQVNISHAVKVTLSKAFLPMFYIRAFALTLHDLRPSLN